MSDQEIPDEAPTVTESTWLEQFEHFGHEALSELRAVVEGGLTPTENDVLIWMAKEFILLAKKHEPEALARVEAALKAAETQTP